MTRAKDISKILTDADLSGTLHVTDSSNAELKLQTDNANGGSVVKFNRSGTDNSYIGTKGYFLGNSDNNLYLRANSGLGIQFYTNGNNERMRIDSSGNLLVGTTSTDDSTDGFKLKNNGQKLTVTRDGAESLVLNRRTSDGDILKFRKDGTAVGSIGVRSGNLQIGTDDVGLEFHDTDNTIYPANVTTQALPDNTISFGSSASRFKDLYLSSAARALEFVGVNDTDTGMQINDTNIIKFSTANGERVRIDGSGNLLVGKTSSGIGTAGIELRSNDDVLITSNGSQALYLNRLSSDGVIAEFRKDGTEIGRIGSVFTSSQSRIFIANSNTGLHFNDGTEQIIPCVSTGAKTDNSIDLGNASGRFDQIFSTNANLNTSDRNEKQDIEELSDAEQRVAVRCKSLVRKYRWIDAVAKKGDNARIHVGIIAQDLQDAFTAEGLDASRYSMFCSDTWWELDGETYYTEEEAPEGATQKTRLGVRYSELLAFIISAI